MARAQSFHEHSINRRLAEIREKLEGPRGKLRFAKRIGESHSNVSRYERGRTIPAHVLARVVKTYGVSARWLLTGRGRMFEPTQAEQIRSLQIALPASEPESASAKPPAPEELAQFQVVPLLRDPDVLAPGRRLTEDDVERPAVVHRSLCAHPTKTDFVRFRSDGMEPTVPNGAIIAIDRTYTRPEASLGKVAAIYVPAAKQVIVRRLQRDSAKPKRYVGVPDNMTPQNQPHVLDEGDRIIGRVVSVHALVK